MRTIFGKHCFAAYVYRRRPHPHTPIALRPVDERLDIEPDRWSPLLQEFTVMFAFEQSFGLAGEFLDALEPPTADEQGELLVLTADGKGGRWCGKMRRG